MAHIYGTSLFCLILFWLANSNPAFAQVLGGSCNMTETCTSIANSTCQNDSCVCVSGYVADSSKKACLPVANELDSACEEKVQCSVFGVSFDCVEKKCIRTEKQGESQVESSTKNTEDEKKSPFANRNYTTPATPSYERGENIEKPTSTEKIKKTEKKGSGGSSVVQISFLGVIWVVHLVM